MAINVNLSGLKDLSSRLKSSGKSMDELLSKVLEDIAAEVIKEAKDLTPVDSGLLRRSYFSSFRKDMDGSYICEVYNNTAYARFVEKGHRIVSNGVTIGWVDGVFMLKISEQRVKRDLDRYVKRSVDRYLKELVK
ncbi:HK97 gp10 family phage protein [Ezakiella peruensis]|uniref:HK97 gp10 family phage protein n=1 Tax=Ezakiella peruensis TaxID=1464038 RepID=UPI000C1B4251|nr:HK97 gp10 family phage protein [Ezakiella peruensis]